MIVGTRDKDRVFYPYSIAICKEKPSQDFKLIFGDLQRCDPEWSPRFLLADGSEPITKGFTDIYGASEKR